MLRSPKKDTSRKIFIGETQKPHKFAGIFPLKHNYFSSSSSFERTVLQLTSLYFPYWTYKRIRYDGIRQLLR